MLKSLTLAASLLAASSALASSANSDRKETSTLKLRATLYVMALESDFPALRDGAFVSTTGKILYRASKKFLTDAKIQGSGLLEDGRILMFAGQSEKGAPRWRISPQPYPIGASGCELVPFRSVSVDKRVIPLGTRLVIEETKGLELPDGSVHDGVWYALDTGGAIKNDRVDLFVGTGKAPLEILKRHGINHLTKLSVKLDGKMPACPSAPQIASK